MSIITVSTGDCVAHLAARVGPQFDSCVCDPPYELSFMGKEWDSSGVAFQVGTWLAVFERMKPGAHLIAFGGTRTYHRMVCAIEDAGFEIRDQLAWLYGSGFPKSHNVSKGIDKATGIKGSFGEPKSAAHAGWIDRGKMRGTEGGEGWQRPWMDDPEQVNNAARKYIGGSEDSAAWDGWGSALKPALEPIVLARKPLSEKSIAANVLRWGVGALNIDGCRVNPSDPVPAGGGLKGGATSRHEGWRRSAHLDGASTAPHDSGRWPANVIHDGSDEVMGAFPRTASGTGAVKRASAIEGYGNAGAAYGAESRGIGAEMIAYGDEGSAARFFYSAKAGPLDRMGSEHPTVKPVDLMRWLCRLVTPPGGLILDPFAGSGTTGIAAMAEGFNAELIDLEPKHVADIERKLALLRGEGRSRFAEQDERKAARPNIAPMPLFGDVP